jgi:RNA polymerase sigma-B factor
MDSHDYDSLETRDIIARAMVATTAEREALEESMVRRFAPLTRRLARKYSWRGCDFEDFMQVASIALVKAMRRFDPERGPFESYAKVTIEGDLKNHVRDYSWSIRPPRRIQEIQSDIRRCAEELAQDDGAMPGVVGIAKRLGAPVADVSEALAARSCHSPSSLDQPVGESGRPLSDSVCGGEHPFDDVDGQVALVQVCRGLTEDELELIRLRYFEDLSQREMAVVLGISQMQVSRRLTRLIARLRSQAREERWAS